MSAPVWVGVDDTDSPSGGCTTYALTEVIDAAHSVGLDLIGEPRLVRLDPNVPFRTRGNAALAARFGHGRGPRRRVGGTDRGPVWSFATGGGPTAAERERLAEAAWRAVNGPGPLPPGTDPAVVVTDRRLPATLYRSAVSRLVARHDVADLLASNGAWVRAAGSGQGIVGAAAAVAWPGLRATWELIAYRPRSRWGAPRAVDAATVRAVQARYPELFLCHDAGTRRLLVAPHTGCPILFGLRARRPERLPRAFLQVVAEPTDRWLLFRTNQGTGDHLTPRLIGALQPFDAARVVGVVTGPPVRLRGGHVRWRIVGPDGAALDCVAFEPTKTLPAVAADLVEGDRVELWGGRGADPTFRVEGIRWLAQASRRGRPRPPGCPACRRPAASLGHRRGYRCPRCGLRLPPEAAVWDRRPAFPRGTYHPTPSARRHLAPLGPEPAAAGGGPVALATDLYGP